MNEPNPIQILEKPFKPKKKREFKMAYRQYSGERGSKEQWQAAFTERLGLDKARILIQDSNPRSILGVDIDCQDWNVIKTAYRYLALQHHPDKGGDHNKFIKIQAALELLESEFNK